MFEVADGPSKNQAQCRGGPPTCYEDIHLVCAAQLPADDTTAIRTELADQQFLQEKAVSAPIRVLHSNG